MNNAFYSEDVDPALHLHS